MKEQRMNDILQKMLPYLDNAQTAQLQNTLFHCFWNVEVCQVSDGEKKGCGISNNNITALYTPTGV